MGVTVRYRSEYLLTMTERAEVVAGGVVDVVDGRVEWSGPAASAPPHEGEEQVLSGLLMPGFVNAHAHSPMVLLRGAGEGLPLERWLTEAIWPREGRLTPDDVAAGMTLGAAELLASGITTTHEMYFHSPALAAAAATAGVRAVVTPPVIAGPGLDRFGPWQEQLEAIALLAEQYAHHDLVTVGVGPHSAYALDVEPLTGVRDLAAREGMHVHIHLAETEHEGDAVTERHGVSVPRFLSDLGLLDTGLVAAHGVWLDDADIELLAARPVGVAHCPVSNAQLAAGIAPVDRLRAAGVPVAVATDGPASAGRLDAFEEMRMAMGLARLRQGAADALGPADVLAMATRQAGRVLGRPDLGTLGPGSRADMIRVDVTALVPVVDDDDLVTLLVNAGSPADVTDVWVEGRQVVAGGEPLGVEAAAARAEVTARAKQISTA